MTSKAAKKAHQLATRGPKVSRLEQRRRDAEELAEQKKEYEREKASVRAKAAREKKAAKKQAERDARRKVGIPEPSRFVRASQPTISRFVKNENKRMWKEMETVADESDTTTVCDDDADQGMQLEPPTKKAKRADESEDEYGGFPSFSQSELGIVLDKIESSAASESNQNSRTECESKEPSEAISIKKTGYKFPWKSSENLDDMAATQLLSEAADAATRSAQQQKPSMIQTHPELVLPRPNITAGPALSMLITKPAYTPPRTIMTSRAALQERSINMPPPPVPIKGKLSISFAPSLSKPRTLPRLPPQPVSNAYLPPSATQSFLEDHLDDFFPSPSQEIRELLDDVDDLPTNTQIPREIEPSLPTAKVLQEDFTNLICTQDFILSSQDILEITTQCPPPSNPNKPRQPTPTPTPSPANPSTRQPRRRFFEEKDEDLLHAAIQESKMLTAQKEQRVHGRKSPGRMLESKTGADKKEQRGQTHERHVSGRMKRAFKRTLSNATDYGEDEFHDCEEELLALC